MFATDRVTELEQENSRLYAENAELKGQLAEYKDAECRAVKAYAEALRQLAGAWELICSVPDDHTSIEEYEAWSNRKIAWLKRVSDE